MIGGLYRRLLTLMTRNIAFTRRAIVALLMIGSLFLAQFGYPVWQVAEQGKGDEQFPCQFSRCGCKTREQCRQSCCCHTRQQKVAWAVERGIDPNRVAVLSAAEQELLTISTPQLAAANPMGCETGSGSCCKSAKKTCCGGVAKSKSKSQFRWVLAIEAQKCRGTGVEWIQAGFVAPPPLHVTLTIIPREMPAVSDVEPFYFSPVAEPLLRPV